MSKNRGNNKVYILNQIRRVAGEIAPQERLTKKLFLSKSDVKDYRLRTNFRSWALALQEAGIDVAPREYPRIPDDDLMQHIGNLSKFWSLEAGLWVYTIPTIGVRRFLHMRV